MSDTSTDHLALLFLVTSIGKSLIKKGVLESDDIIAELQLISEAIEFGTPGSELLKLEITDIIRKVSDWETT